MKIQLASYNPDWPILFQKEKDKLSKALTGFAPIIEHIGSTAVPGLSAKPIIDIQIGLPDFKLADELVPKITALGYEYVDKWEKEIPHRRFFTKSNNGVRTHHIHMVGHGTDWWKRHLRFRDYLRENEKARDAYFQLKKELAEKEWDTGSDYAGAKTEFIQNIEKQSLK